MSLLAQYWKSVKLRATYLDNHHFLEAPHRLDTYEPLNRPSSRIVRVVAASEQAQEFRIGFQSKGKINNCTSSVYSHLYGTFHNDMYLILSRSPEHKSNLRRCETSSLTQKGSWNWRFRCPIKGTYKSNGFDGILLRSKHFHHCFKRP